MVRYVDFVMVLRLSNASKNSYQINIVFMIAAGVDTYAFTYVPIYLLQYHKFIIK